MKVIILGALRTRSSYLLNSVCKFYNLEQKWEPYDNLMREVSDKSFFKNEQILWSNYKQETCNLTKLLLANDNFALKFFSLASFNFYKVQQSLIKNKEFYFIAEDVLDLQKNIQIERYDQIYFLTRNDYKNNIISYLFGSGRKLLFLEEYKHLIKSYDKPVYLHYNKIDLQLMLIQNLLLEVFEKQLRERRLDYTKLDYEEVPNFVSTNFDNIRSDYVETKYDYKKIVKNYDEILNVIEESKQKFEPIIGSLLS